MKLRTDENLCELRRGTTIANIIPVWFGWYHQAVHMKNLSELFVEHIPKEFGRVELIKDSYRKLSLKHKEQEGWGASAKIQRASLKSKVVNNFQHFQTFLKPAVVAISHSCKRFIILEYFYTNIKIETKVGR